MLQISCLYETKYFSRNCSFLIKFVLPLVILGLHPWGSHGHSSYLGYQSHIYYHSGDFLSSCVKNVPSGLESVLTLWTQTVIRAELWSYSGVAYRFPINVLAA